MSSQICNITISQSTNLQSDSAANIEVAEQQQSSLLFTETNGGIKRRRTSVASEQEQLQRCIDERIDSNSNGKQCASIPIDGIWTSTVGLSSFNDDNKTINNYNGSSNGNGVRGLVGPFDAAKFPFQVDFRKLADEKQCTVTGANNGNIFMIKCVIFEFNRYKT